MMKLGVLGVNHKLADLKLREQLAQSCQKRFGTDHVFHGCDQIVLLSTCNRTELYFCSEDLAETHTYLLSQLRCDIDIEFEHKLYSYFGVDCFSHLTRVATGLDSAVLGETEIQGQVKQAYELAAASRKLSKEIHFLFQKGLGIAKKIRTDVPFGRGLLTLEESILQTANSFFKPKTEPRLLFIGASEINQKICLYIKRKYSCQITLCNRTNERAEELAKTLEIASLKWEDLHLWPQYDWIIVGTKSPHPLLIADASTSLNHNILIMDLSVPRNVAPELGQKPGFTLMNIDEMNRLLILRQHSVNQTLKEAESMLAESVHRQIDAYHRREYSKISLLPITA